MTRARALAQRGETEGAGLVQPREDTISGGLEATWQGLQDNKKEPGSSQ